MTNENKCTHEQTEMIEPTLIDDLYIEQVIIEYTEKCVHCGEIVDTERHRYKFDAIVPVSDDSG